MKVVIILISMLISKIDTTEEIQKKFLHTDDYSGSDMFLKHEDLLTQEHEAIKFIVSEYISEKKLLNKELSLITITEFKNNLLEFITEKQLYSEDFEDIKTESLIDVIAELVPDGNFKTEDLSKNGSLGLDDDSIIPDDDIDNILADDGGPTRQEIIELKDIVIEFMTERQIGIEDFSVDLDELKNNIIEFFSEKSMIKKLEATELDLVILQKIIEELKTEGINKLENSFKQKSLETQDSAIKKDVYTPEDNDRFLKLKNIVKNFLTENLIGIEDLLPLELDKFKKKVNKFISEKKIEDQEIKEVESEILRKIVEEIEKEVFIEATDNSSLYTLESQERASGREINMLEDDGSSTNHEIEKLKIQFAEIALESSIETKDILRHDSVESQNERAKTEIYMQADYSDSTNHEIEKLKIEIAEIVPKSSNETTAISSQDSEDFQHKTDDPKINIPADEDGSTFHEIEIFTDRGDQLETDGATRFKNYSEDFQHATDDPKINIQADEDGSTIYEIEIFTDRGDQLETDGVTRFRNYSEDFQYKTDGPQINIQADEDGSTFHEIEIFTDRGDQLETDGVTRFRNYSEDFQYKTDGPQINIQADEDGSTINEIEIFTDRGDQLETDGVTRFRNYSEDFQYKTDGPQINIQADEDGSTNQEIETLISIVSDFINKNKIRMKEFLGLDAEVLKNMLIDYMSGKQMKTESIIDLDSLLLRNIIEKLLQESISEPPYISRSDSKDFQEKSASSDTNIKDNTDDHTLIQIENSKQRFKDPKFSKLYVISHSPQKSSKKSKPFDSKSCYQDNECVNTKKKTMKNLQNDKNKSNAFFSTTQISDEVSPLVPKKMYLNPRILRSVFSVPDLFNSAHYENASTYSQMQNVIGHNNFYVKENENTKVLNKDSVLNNENKITFGDSYTEKFNSTVGFRDNSQDFISQSFNKKLQKFHQKDNFLDTVNKFQDDKSFNRITLTFLASKRRHRIKDHYL
ncbi:hypothetical protein NBO_490g0001 [Nosema bombycis CQ1]|uniref:Uncharacterized protein n=1 Tax=Nosema bombycis (strain CQ1 / CVCC 102059) TaxID=578461 RepID=R0M2H8_NOSB1|nr:hypothetical protein NBO_490g0001 [Nosema bombycis CQ1]|eukprot:EOB12244.1 hypothetical protein NBO_490g0001 [Nosema bombycis CQ1]